MRDSGRASRQQGVRGRVAAALVALISVVAASSSTSEAQASTVWYVDADAIGVESGMTWGNAFTSFEDALTAAADGDEIWVSEGDYGGTFFIYDNVEIYGGFDGFSTPTFADRDPSVHFVRFTSPLLITSPNPDPTIAFIDGVVAKDGISVGDDDHGTLTNVVIDGSGSSGAIVYGGELDLVDVTISNTTDQFSAGLDVQGGTVRGRRVTVTTNQTTGVRVSTYQGQDPALKLVDSHIVSNQFGLLVGGTNADVEVVDTIIEGNARGVAVSYLPSAVPTTPVILDRVTIRNNQGYGLSIGEGRSVQLTNSIVANNIEEEVLTFSFGTQAVPPGTVTIWGSTIVDQILVGDQVVDPLGVLEFVSSIVDLPSPPDSTSISTFEHSLVRGSDGSGADWSYGGGVDGGSNIDLDPQFESSVTFELGPYSPAIEAGTGPPIEVADRIVDVDGDDRSFPWSIGAQRGTRARLSLLDESCLAYDSTNASGALGGGFLGDQLRTVDLTGTLTGQGGDTSCLPTDAVAALVSIQAFNPLAAGNLRLSESGVTPTGGVVNYAANGLDNTNTVTVPLSAEGWVDIAANGGPTGVGLPSTHVRLRVLGWYSTDGDLKFTPLTPCAAHDSRSNQGATGGYLGPFATGSGPNSVRLADPLPPEQGGMNNGGCGGFGGLMLANIVAVNSTGGSGFITQEQGASPMPIVAFADIGMNNAAVIPTQLSVQGLPLAVDGDATAASETRAVVLGVFRTLGGNDYTPVNPCAAFDSRSSQQDPDGLVGPFVGGETVTYQIAGDALPAVQGGENGGDCGVPEGATAVLINLVGVGSIAAGNIQAYATGTTPTGGVLNFAALSPAMNNANAVPVPLSAEGTIDITLNGGPSGVGVPLTDLRGVVLGFYS